MTGETRERAWWADTFDRHACIHSMMDQECIGCWIGHAARMGDYVQRLRDKIEYEDIGWLQDHDQFWLGANGPGYRGIVSAPSPYRAPKGKGWGDES